jgi:type III pantothenate kinase
MNLAIDIGNTRIKMGFFEGDVLQIFDNDVQEQALMTLISDKKPETIILSSVRKDIDSLVHQITAISPLMMLDASLPLPIQNLYQTPATLGVDRIAAAVGATKLFSDKPCLVLDMGTAITYDVIDKTHHFLGGNIAPGMKMRFDALYHFTSKLPHLQADVQKDYSDFIGKSTSQAIENGVIWGIIWEIEGIVRTLKQKYEDLVIIVTGGDAVFFEKRLKEQIFVAPNLTLIGLNTILEYNVKKTN